MTEDDCYAIAKTNTILKLFYEYFKQILNKKDVMNINDKNLNVLYTILYEPVLEA